MLPLPLDIEPTGSPLRQRFVEYLTEGKLVLPLLPDTAASVITLCGDESCDAQALADLIQRDVSMAGHVLRISNSAAYAPNEPIVSLPQAVSRLGFSSICGIAVGVAAQGKMFQIRGFEAELRVLWKHCAMAGAWAKEIARLRRRNVEGAFMCGLLHDIGRPIVLQAIVDLQRKESLESTPEETRSLMDEFHEYVGARLLTEWDLPEWVAGAVLHHHRFDEAGEFQEEAATASLADLLAHWSMDEANDDKEVFKNIPALPVLGLYADELEPLFERAEFVAECAEAFQQ